MFHADLLDGRIDHHEADFHIKTFFIQDEIVHPLKVEEQGAFHMRVGSGTVKSSAVRNVRKVISIADFEISGPRLSPG
jgi:hypothetical protein